MECRRCRVAVTLCDPMWHVSSRSGVATLRTAIHLLLTYLHALGGPEFHLPLNFWGVVSPLKCIRLCKQQTAQQHGAADLSAGAVRHGESAVLAWTRPMGAGAMRPFVNVLWPLVGVILRRYVRSGAVVR